MGEMLFEESRMKRIHEHNFMTVRVMIRGLPNEKPEEENRL